MVKPGEYPERPVNKTRKVVSYCKSKTQAELTKGIVKCIGVSESRLFGHDTSSVEATYTRPVRTGLVVPSVVFAEPAPRPEGPVLPVPAVPDLSSMPWEMPPLVWL